MRVDIATSNTAPPGSPHFEHQRHVLHQYSAHNLHQESNQEADSNRNESTTHSGLSMNLMPSADHNESGDILSMLTPKVNLCDTWEAGKSLPVSAHSLSSRPHSCHQTETLKLSSKIEPHMPATVTPCPSPTPTYTRPHHHSAGGLDANMTIRHHTGTQPAVMYDAWAIANPSISDPKHTLLSSSRLMSKLVTNM